MLKNRPNSLRAFLCAFLFVSSIISCQEDDQAKISGTAEVKFSLKDVGSTDGRQRAESDPASIILSISDGDGTAVHTRKLVSLVKFGDEYLSRPISLVVGAYTLTEFFVVNEDGDVIYAAPLEGSDLAHLVNNPVPIDFTVEKDVTSNINVEVLSAESSTPANFGYTTFSFDIVNTFSFHIGVFIHNDTTENFALTSAQLWAVSADNTTEMATSLDAVTSTIRLRDEGTGYVITVSKTGYESFEQLYTIDELKQYTNDEPLIVILSEDATVINGALSFDGIDDHINLGDVYDDVDLPITISAWVYLEPEAPYSVLFASQDNEPLYNGFTFAATHYQVAIGYGDGRGENNGAFRRGFGGATDTFGGRWVYIAGVMRGGFTDMSVYVDGTDIGGTQEGSSDQPMASNYPNDVAKIGKYSTNGTTWHFKGLLDELKIWNRVLSDEEIAENMTKRLTGNEDGLIGYWTFDEADGVIVYDKSSNGFHGAMINGPTRVESGIPVLND